LKDTEETGEARTQRYGYLQFLEQRSSVDNHPMYLLVLDAEQLRSHSDFGDRLGFCATLVSIVNLCLGIDACAIAGSTVVQQA
jgi:hypothetical protein